MIQCKECSKEISSDARVCPHCGKKQGQGCATTAIWVVFCLLGFCVLLAVISQMSDTPKTPQEAAADAAKGAHLKAMIDSAMALRNAMRDPDSFKLTQVLDMPDGAVCYSYRARNGFGGMDQGEAVLFDGKFLDSSMAGFHQLNEQECVGKTGKVETDFINSELESHPD